MTAGVLTLEGKPTPKKSVEDTEFDAKGTDMASKIEDYGLIGNTYTGALVSRSGSIDWLCAPRFDSDACLTALIGYDEHGRWSLRPTVEVRETRQRYRDDTMMLETEFG